MTNSTFLTYSQINPKVANRWRELRLEALRKEAQKEQALAEESADNSKTFSTNNRVANRQRNLRQSRRRTKR